MDKKKAVNRLIDMMEKLPNAEVRDMAYILIDIINEMDDRDTRDHVRIHMDATIREENDYLSFAQALEAAAKGKRVTHETWSKRTYITQVGDRFVRASIDSDNVDDRIGITTEMLTGWIVLDR